MTDIDTTQPAPKTYPYEDGEVLVLGPELFIGQPGTPGEGVISYQGENFYRTLDGKPPVAPAPVVEKKLSEYSSGDIVDVIKDGEWRVGSVNGVEKKLGMVYVHTDRGPVTVASMRNIRPHQS